MTIKKFIDMYYDSGYFSALIEELKLRDPNHIIALCKHTDGSPTTLVTYEPRECDLKQMRIEELCEKFLNKTITDEESDELAAITPEMPPWVAPSGINRGKIDDSITTIDLSHICK